MSSRFKTALIILLVVFAPLSCAGKGDTQGDAPSVATAPPVAEPAREFKPEEMTRLEPHEVRPLVQSGEALLVCAYDSDEKFENNRLEGAVSLSDFEQRLPALGKDQLIVFYCS